MRKHALLSVALLLAVASSNAPAHALTQDELVAKIEAAGYSKVSDIKSTAEGTTAKAVKDGKQVRLVIDSSGQIKQRD
ncbi:PepSY domain-containing protein [Bradyrhizobium pachyrhizi]|uniref:PepSY domain-containing protein n=1 Tax=Bradyrhizobium pachyrhizi TaxID=280333 RepID=UPI003D364D53